MTFGSESDQQRTPSQASTLSPSLSSRENRSTTSPQESVETVNILDSIIPTQVSSNSNLEHSEHSEFNVMEAFDAIHWHFSNDETVLLKIAAVLMHYLRKHPWMVVVLMYSTRPVHFYILCVASVNLYLRINVGELCKAGFFRLSGNIWMQHLADSK